MYFSYHCFSLTHNLLQASSMNYSHHTVSELVYLGFGFLFVCLCVLFFFLVLQINRSKDYNT